MSVIYIPLQLNGYRRREDEVEWVRENSSPVFGAGLSDGDRPEEVDPDWMQIERQIGNSCGGHAGSTMMELLYAQETGTSIQLSRSCYYRGAQTTDGWNTDSGSSIPGGLDWAQKYGVCLEQTWPHRGFERNPPGGWEKIKQEAANYKLGEFQWTESYDAAWAALGTGKAAGVGGFPWFNELDEMAARNGGVINKFSSRWRVRGWHAVPFSGYIRKHPRTGATLEEGGKPYIKMPNSWDRSYGDDGNLYWMPSAFEEWLNYRGSVLAMARKIILGPGAIRTPLPPR